MFRYKMFAGAALIAVLLICSQCGLFPTKSENNAPQFIIDLDYSGKLASDQSTLFFNHGEQEPAGSLRKPDAGQAIDMVRVMVLDFSKYKDMNDFYESEEAHEFEHLLNDWTGGLDYWSEWERLFSKVFSIASNQILTIEGDSATGTVPGVLGLNYFIIAMLKDGKIRYGGGEEAIGEEGKTNSVQISMWEWSDYYYDYYYETTVDSVVISPKQITLQSGQSQKFTCRVYYSDGTYWDTSTAPVWTTDPGEAGTISATGTFIASTTVTGTETITATYYTSGDDLTDTATVTVIPYIIGPYPP